MNRHAILLLSITCLLFFLSSCAPKKIRVYEDAGVLRSRVVELSVSLIGKPYLAGGKGPEKFDCSGLIYFVFKSFNIDLPLSTEKLLKSGIEVRRENVLPGDIVFFKIQKDLHAGIIINKNEFIHASKSRGVTVDNINSPYWEKHLLCFRSIIF
jgi:cell wall-associated NlpC family hydrolase